jgi:acetyl esterase/lipase
MPWQYLLTTLTKLTLTLLVGILCSTAVSLHAQVGSVSIEKDVAYLGEDRQEKADLYLPPGSTATGATSIQLRPGIVIIHGGGWTGGDKGAAREQNIGTTLAMHGYVCLSINYLLQPKEGERIWPRNLYDCKTAVRWLRANAERLHVDAENIGVIGGSAGGHLALMVGVTNPASKLDPERPYGEYSCAVRAVIDLYGPIADTPKWRATLVGSDCAQAPQVCEQVTPLSHLDAKDPPVMIIHGTGDTTVALRDSEVLADALQRAGIEHQLIVIPDAPHSFHLQPKQRDLRPAVLEFLDKHLKANTNR